MFLAIERRHCISGYALYEKGLLPSAGGWLTQPEWWLQAFEVIGAAVAQIRAEQRAAHASAPAPDDEGMS